MRKIFFILTFLVLFCFPIALLAQQPIRVNCGGPAYADSKGQLWSADHGFNTGSLYSTTSSISGTPDQKLYQTERYGGTILYSFPLPNGSYTVNVLLAEIYYHTVGARVINIKVQGALAFPNVDIYALVGANTALTKSTNAAVINGTLTVEFDSPAGGSKCSAIEILPGTSGPPVPSGPPLTLNFKYPDGTPVAGTLNYSIASSLLSFQGSALLTNGQAQCVLFANPSALGISAQFAVTLNLTDSAGHQLWQVNLAMNPAQVNLGAIQTSSLNVVVQKL